MKALFLFVALALALPAFPQSMKMVVDAEGNVVGRYVKTNADTYTIGVQDIFDVPKSGKRIVIYRAKDGKGIIWPKKVGRVNVYDAPDTKSKTIGYMVYEEYSIPDSYQCLGKKRGWYKVRFDGKTGYVRSKLVQWDGMDTM